MRYADCSLSHWLAFICWLRKYHIYHHLIPRIRRSAFLIKFCGDLADQAGGVVVREGCSHARDSGFDTAYSDLQLFFFFNLTGKNSLIVKNFYASRKWQRPFISRGKVHRLSRNSKTMPGKLEMWGWVYLPCSTRKNLSKGKTYVRNNFKI